MTQIQIALSAGAFVWACIAAWWAGQWVGERVSRLRVYIEPRDVWIGVYVAPHAIYVCPLPMLVFRWART